MKLDFIETKYLPEPPNLRQLIDMDNKEAAMAESEASPKKKRKDNRKKKSK